MLPTRMQFGSYRSSIIELKGGINENVSSLELEGGELVDCRNYMIAEGGYGGYQSIKGYERMDGQGIPSEYTWKLITLYTAERLIVEGELLVGAGGANATALADSVLLSGTYGVDAKITVEVRLVNDAPFVYGEDVSIDAVVVGSFQTQDTILVASEEFHGGLDYAMNRTQKVPGQGPILGLHIFKEKVYAFRRKTGEAAPVGFYVEDDTSSGWLEIDTSGAPLTYGEAANFKFTNYNFYGSDTESSGFEETMYWVDGVNRGRSYNPTDGVDVIDNAGMHLAGLDQPTHIIAHNYYLLMAYRGGSLQHSVLGQPHNWLGEEGAGEFGLGSEIRALEVGQQNALVIFQDSGIQILQGQVYAGDYADATLEAFSENSGAFDGTVKRLLGTLFFIDDRGLTTMQQTAEYGDYAANSISQRFAKTLKSKTHNITTTLVSRDLNQYRVFFDDGKAVYVSFEGTDLKGSTIIELNRAVSIAAQGERDDTDFLVFSSTYSTEENNGWVYKLDSGTSFDGDPITTRMATAFFHYGSPRQWKAFRRATMEISGEQEQEFDIKVDFNYNEQGSPRSIWYTKELYNIDGTAIYGDGIFGEMKYGASGVGTESVPLYLMGVGVNMSYKIISNEIYRQPHIIQNIITDYEVVGRRT